MSFKWTADDLITATRSNTNGASFTTVDRDSRNWNPGDFIFNTTDDEFQVYKGSANTSVPADWQSMLMPSLTTSERLLLTPSEGTIVYDTDLKQHFYYTSTGSWSSISGNVVLTDVEIIDFQDYALEGSSVFSSSLGVNLSFNGVDFVRLGSDPLCGQAFN